jgi:large subunit ribosomal protein L13
LKKKFPKKIIENAIKRMLPKNKLIKKKKKYLFKNLYIYLDNKHPHQAQKPKKIKMKWNKKHL